MTCIRCSRDSIVDLSYGGGRLCGDCFTRLFEKRVKKTIRKNRLLSGDDKLLVALSGGKDSLTVLKILHEIVEPNPNTSIEALTVDEGIGGCSSDRLSASQRVCGDLSIPHHVVSFMDYFGFTLDEFLENDGLAANPCTYCGVLRRRIVNNKARELGSTKVVTGHNLDDEVQAALMNFARGEVERIARLGPRVGVVDIEGFVPRIKPLREVLEDEIRLYARLNEFPVAESGCPHNKGAYRKSMAEVIDLLEERHSGSKYQMLASVDKLSAYLAGSIPGEAVGSCSVCGEPASGKKCRVCLILEGS